MIGWLMNNELERIQMVAVLAKFKAMSRYLPGGSEENYKEPESGYQVSGPRFEPGTFRIRSRSANHPAEIYICSRTLNMTIVCGCMYGREVQLHPPNLEPL
jgi:hypothetical protein